VELPTPRVWIIPLAKICDISWVYVSEVLPGGWNVTTSPTYSGPLTGRSATRDPTQSVGHIDGVSMNRSRPPERFQINTAAPATSTAPATIMCNAPGVAWWRCRVLDKKERRRKAPTVFAAITTVVIGDSDLFSQRPWRDLQCAGRAPCEVLEKSVMACMLGTRSRSSRAMSGTHHPTRAGSHEAAMVRTHRFLLHQDAGRQGAASRHNRNETRGAGGPIG
jgi:hypothetical protein